MFLNREQNDAPGEGPAGQGHGPPPGSYTPSLKDPEEQDRLDEQYEHNFGEKVGLYLRAAGVQHVADIGCAGGASLRTLAAAGVKMVSGYDANEGPLTLFAQRAQGLGLVVRETRLGRFDGRPVEAECSHFTCVAMHAGPEATLAMCSASRFVVLGESDFHEAGVEGSPILARVLRRIRELSPNGESIRPRLIEALLASRGTISAESYETEDIAGAALIRRLRFLKFVSPGDWQALVEDPDLGRAHLHLPFLTIFARRETS